jgi:branched-chain amino acid aminotransferase
MTTVWMDGRVMDASHATVAALDHGLTVGDGVFETVKVTHGRPFAISRHLRRLAASAQVLELDCPPADRILAGIGQLLSAGPSRPLARLRITVTGGAGPLGSARGTTAPTLILALAPASPWPDQIEVVTLPWPRNERSAVAGAKTTSYAENVVALNAAHRHGAHEALLPNTAGWLCEGTGSNVLVVRDGRLATPPLSSGCLAGITRELFLEWAAAEGLPVEERNLAIDALADADDVLLTSTTRDVQQVEVVDGRKVPGSQLGRVAVELFGRRAAEHCDP